jgi:hypothetical protein
MNLRAIRRDFAALGRSLLALGVFALSESARADSFPLIPFGSNWRYLDNGSDQGIAWRDPSFNDAAWQSGPAQLGYEDDDEATVVRCGLNHPNCNQSVFVTHYFRQAFAPGELPPGAALVGRILRDDAAAVYLNGVEVFRDRHLSPIANSGTLASRQFSDNAISAFSIPRDVLVSGINVLAVEVHNSSDASVDASFDLELRVGDLTVITLPEFNGPNISQGFPTGATEFGRVAFTPPAGRHVSGVVVDGMLGNTTVNNGPQVDVTFDGVRVAQCVTGNFCFGLPLAFTHSFDPVELATFADDELIGRVVQRAAGAVRLDRMTLVVETSAGPRPEVRQLIPLGANWRYWDRGGNPGQNWSLADFDDDSWSIGRAPLGYGDGDETTIINCGPSAPNCRMDNHATTYFRQDFMVDEPAGLQEFVLRVLRDDAAAVYVNGIEVFRDEILETGAGPATFARAVSIENAQATIRLDPEVLLVGRNVVAVEVHQESPTSSDLSFDLRLTATVTPIPEPTGVVSLAMAVGLFGMWRLVRRGGSK